MNCDHCWQPVKRRDPVDMDKALYHNAESGKNFCSAQCSVDNHEANRVRRDE